MRGVGSRVVLSVVVMAIVVGVAVPLSGQSPSDQAATVLAATQKALGGNLLPIEFQTRSRCQTSTSAAMSFPPRTAARR